ncbi:MAG: aminotransferase class V-fold PLP-dependent enzyme [Azospirillaceae bacterium]
MPDGAIVVPSRDDHAEEAALSALRQAFTHAAAFRRSLADRPHRPRLDYRQMRDALMRPLPERGLEGAEVIDDLAASVEPGLMAMPAAGFFGWVLGASHPVGVAADWLASAWGQNSAYHTPTPGTAAIEEVAEAWLLDLLDLPRESSIGFCTGATVSSFVCLAAARGQQLRAHGWDPDADGLFGAPPVHVFIGAEAHQTVFAGLQYLGFGHRRVVTVPADTQGRMYPEALAREMAARSGPMIVIAQSGQINTGAFDPFPAICRIARAHGAWVHVDGAFGLWARACPDTSFLTEGIELCDSWSMDAHKWLQTPFDTGFAIVRHREDHRRAMTIHASYLPEIAGGDRVPSALVPELSRRARGLPVWAMLRHLGRDGVAEMVGRHCRLARHMAARLSAESGVRVLNEVVLNQVIVQFGDGDRERRKKTTAAVIAAVQESEACFVAGSDWGAEWVMRISVISHLSDLAAADRAVDAMIACWRRLRAGG